MPGFSCRETCRRHRLARGTPMSGVDYTAGEKSCSVCAMAFGAGMGTYCPCCSSKLRTRPASNRARRRAREEGRATWGGTSPPRDGAGRMAARVTGHTCARCDEGRRQGDAPGVIEQLFARTTDGTLVSLVMCVKCGRARRVK